jgi:Uma2 family endonuclease
VPGWKGADPRAKLSSMGDPVRKRARYEDLLELPPHRVGEIIDGELYAQRRPAIRHAKAASVLGGELEPTFGRARGGPGGWVILDEPELHLGPEPDVLVPDLAGWRRERMPELPDAAYLTLAPDWVCEVLSESTRRVDRSKKLPVYARERVKHVWFVDPIARTLEILRLDRETYRLVVTFADDEPCRAEPFEAIALDLAAVWAR